MQNRVIATLLLTGLIITGGCGYKFAGGGELPKGVQTIFIDLFENRSRDVDLETQLANDLTNEFILKRKKALAAESKAEAILTGTIAAVNSSTISQTKKGASVERRLTMVVHVVLHNRQGEKIWQRNNITEYEEYLVGVSSSETDVNRDEALTEITERMAEQIFYKLTDEF